MSWTEASLAGVVVVVVVVVVCVCVCEKDRETEGGKEKRGKETEALKREQANVIYTF